MNGAQRKGLQDEGASVIKNSSYYKTGCPTFHFRDGFIWQDSKIMFKGQKPLNIERRQLIERLIIEGYKTL